MKTNQTVQVRTADQPKFVTVMFIDTQESADLCDRAYAVLSTVTGEKLGFVVRWSTGVWYATDTIKAQPEWESLPMITGSTHRTMADAVEDLVLYSSGAYLAPEKGGE